MDLFNSKQQELSYNISTGNVLVNLYTGRMMYEYHDITLGINNFSIPLYHVYNSEFVLPSDMDTHLPSRWKFNIQQYLYKVQDNYIYINAQGQTIYFKPFSTYKYFDTSGLGLTLTTSTSGDIISDMQGNQMHFSNNRLVKTVSCDNITKIYKYMDDRLDVIYDSRRPEYKIIFHYNDDDLIEKVFALENNKARYKVKYYYDENKKLKYIVRESNGVSKYDVEILYNSTNGLVQKITNLIDETGIYFTYLSNKVSSVTTGTVELTTSSKKYYSDYVDEGVYLDGSIYLGEQYTRSEKIVSIDNTISGDNINDKNTINYMDSYTNVINLQGVSLNYYFDAKGNSVSALEKISDTHFRTLSKMSGCQMLTAGSEVVQINGLKGNKISSSTTISSSNYISNQLNQIQTYIEGSSNKHFICKFWMKLSTEFTYSKVLLVFSKYDEDNNIELNYYSTVRFNPNAYDVWQEVQIPIDIDSSEINYIALSFEENDASKNLIITDMVLCEGEIQRVQLKEEPVSLYLEEVDGIQYKLSGTNETNYLRMKQGNYLTLNDLMLTYYYMYFNRNSLTSFPVFYNDGADFKNVSTAIFNFFSNEVTCGLNYDSISEIYKFNFELGTKHQTTEISFFYDSELGKNVQKQITTKKIDTKENSSYIISDLKGKTLFTEDSYGVQTLYDYDSYGVLNKKTISYKGATEEEKLVTTYYYTNALNTTTTDGITSGIKQDKILGTVNSIYTSCNGTTDEIYYKHDALGQNVNSIGNGINYNYMKYDKKGNMIDCSSENYNVENRNSYFFRHNIFDSQNKTYTNECLICNKDYFKKQEVNKIYESILDKTNNKVTIKIYRENNVVDEIVTTYDKYNNIVSKTNFEIEKENCKESTYLSKITKIIDTIINSTESIEYRENGEMSKNTITYSDNSKLVIDRANHRKYKYYESDGSCVINSTMELVYDDNLLSPLLTASRAYVGEMESIDTTILNKTAYNYDKFKRLSAKLTYMEADTGETGLLKKDINYVTGSNVLQNICYQFGIKSPTSDEEMYNPIKHNYIPTFDNLGKITNIKLIHTKNGVNNEYNTSYTYDDSNQLLSETSTKTGATRLYSYDNNGNIKSINKGNISKNYQYSYDKGRLVSVTETNPNLVKALEYDNYGNITKYDNIIYEWERGSLLKRYYNGDTKVEVNFQYDGYGRRYKKIVTNGLTTTYLYDGNLLIGEKYSNGYHISYLYDAQELIGFYYSENGKTYYYVKDIQGNITGVIHGNELLESYEYDAYGNILSLTTDTNKAISKKNPFKWKDYYYDVETNLFLVTSRYYSPELGRFIQPADVSSLNPSSINGLNLYSYANNNPIGIAYSSSGAGFGTSGGMLSSLSLGGSIGAGTIGGDSSSWFTTLPAVPNALKHISKANDVFSAVSHSFMVGKYLFGNGKLHTLSYLDDMRMLGANPTKGLHSLQPKWLKRMGYAFSAIDGIIAIYDNLQQGNSWGQALLDGALSFGKSAASAWVGGFVGANVGGMIGAALGSIIPIPGVGTFIGFVVGTGAGIVVSWFVDDVLGLLKDGLLDLIFD